MNITIERSHRINGKALVAFLDVCVDGTFIIRGCKVIKSNTGRFIGMPSQKDEKSGKYNDHVTFKTKELKNEFSSLVLSAFDGNSGASKSNAKTQQNNGSSDRTNGSQEDVRPEDISWEE
jgi:DNA-binding cell septation regulator SpoVG